MRKESNLQTHFVSVDFARIHMKQMTVYEAEQRLDNSILWRWSTEKLADRGDRKFLDWEYLPHAPCVESEIDFEALPSSPRSVNNPENLPVAKMTISNERDEIKRIEVVAVANDQPSEVLEMDMNEIKNVETKELSSKAKNTKKRRNRRRKNKRRKNKNGRKRRKRIRCFPRL